MEGKLANNRDIETVEELKDELPPGWLWHPLELGSGEVQRLLQRYAERGLPESARQETIESATNIIARCIPPDHLTDSRETGLVVGYVQSGKTLSFTTLAALACDNHFPLIIILSGTKKNLYSQTVKRLRRDLDLEKPAGRWVMFEAQTRNSDLPQQLGHLLENWDQPELAAFPRKTAIITVLKNRQRVEGLVSALRQLPLEGRPCLIIDDEADQAGLNTRIRVEDRSSVYNALLSLRDAIPRHTYIQYTATPQALLLIHVFDSLSPKFGWVLSAGNGYCGGEEFFDRYGRRLVSTIPDYDLLAGEENADDGPPRSLLTAMRLFYVGVAVQAVRRGLGETTEEYRSMLVHPSMHKMDHLHFKRWVEGATDSWIDLLELPASDADRGNLVQDFRLAYEELGRTVEECVLQNARHEALPTFDDVLLHLAPAMRDTLTWEVNSRVVEQWNQENWPSASSHILVGGENLGRGFTVEGLTTTYMPRGRGSGVADTIQQRGRFFGYKSNYLGLCRVFLPHDVRSDYENYMEHESYVMEQLRQLSKSGSAMADWRRKMLLAQSLRPTRRSVIPDIYRHLRVSEWTRQTQPLMPGAVHGSEQNWDTIGRFTSDLMFTEDPGSERRTLEQRHALAREVPLALVLEDLLVGLWFSPRDAPNFSAAELAIQWHLRDNPDAIAHVYRMAAYSTPQRGGGTRRRQVDSEGAIVNLFQGPAPVDPVRLRGTTYPGDQRIRAEHSVTLQIHDLDLTDKDRNLLRGHVPVVALWVPDHMRVGVFDEMAS